MREEQSHWEHLAVPQLDVAKKLPRGNRRRQELDRQPGTVGSICEELAGPVEGPSSRRQLAGPAIEGSSKTPLSRSRCRGAMVSHSQVSCQQEERDCLGVAAALELYESAVHQAKKREGHPLSRSSATVT